MVESLSRSPASVAGINKIPDQSRDLAFYLDNEMLGTYEEVIKGWINQGLFEKAAGEINQLKQKGTNRHMTLAVNLENYLNEKLAISGSSRGGFVSYYN